MHHAKTDDVTATTTILKMAGNGTFLTCWDFENDKITIGLVRDRECKKSA